MPVFIQGAEGVLPAARFFGGERPEAAAEILGIGAYEGVRGTVRFLARPGGCVVEADIDGLPPPSASNPSMFFGFHIHESGSCANGGEAAGGHYNPGGQPHGQHAGDLPSLLSAGGRAKMSVFTNRFTPEQIVGRSVIIHADPDDFRTQPSGHAGGRIACGVIRRV